MIDRQPEDKSGESRDNVIRFPFYRTRLPGFLLLDEKSDMDGAVDNVVEFVTARRRTE